MTSAPNNVAQVGGDHYSAAGKGHWDIMEEYDVAYLEANATRYVVRLYRKGLTKEKRLEDCQKAISYVKKLITTERGPRRVVPVYEVTGFSLQNGMTADQHDILLRLLCPTCEQSFVWAWVGLKRLESEIEASPDA